MSGDVMELEFVITGNTVKSLEDKAVSQADRFYGYTAKIKHMNNRKKPPVEEYIDNPDPRPYKLYYQRATVIHNESYDPVYSVTVQCFTEGIWSNEGEKKTD
jgi:hypothetical protein